MTGSPLIALPPSPASPDYATVAGDGWWPEIDRNAARDALRLGEVVTDARLVAALEGAWLTVTGDLAEWQAQLAALPSPPATLETVTAAHLSMLQVPARGPYWATWNDATRIADQMGDNPFAPKISRYTPARAAWLAGTMTDTASGDTLPRLCILFIRATRMVAASELVQLYRDMGMTTKGDVRAEAMLDTGADYRRMAGDAVRDILGTPRITSELI